jgi:capsular polysaccharide biosynthesis protein
MPFPEQVRLFQSAKYIVAPHGAGLANLVFCQPGASVVEILPSEQTNLCYWLLSQQVSLKYYYVLGSLTGPPAWDIEVDPDKLQSTLNLALHASVAGRRVRVIV